MKRLLFFLALALALFVGIPGYPHAQPDSTASPKTKLDPTLEKMVALVDQVQSKDSLEASKLLLLPYRAEIELSARRYRLPAALIAGVIQQESVWEPWAERTEPAYLRKPSIRRAARTWSADHNGIPSYQTELGDRSRSMGLMQPMGELAREQGFADRYLSALFVPANSIDQGAKLLKKLLVKYHNDTLAAISAYNQGNARKRHGTFANARYVYRVQVGWEAWKSVFDTVDNETVHKANSTRTGSIRHSLSTGLTPWEHVEVIPIANPDDPAQDFHNFYHAYEARQHERLGHDSAAAITSGGAGQPPLQNFDSADAERQYEEWQRSNADALWGFGAVFAVVVSGYVILEWRRKRLGGGHGEGVSRPGERFV